MSKFLLATTAAVVALTFSSRAFSETDRAAFPQKVAQDQTQSGGPRAVSPLAKDQTGGTELGAIEQQLKELAETRLQQYVPREQDRAGVLAFYRNRNFAPLWVAENKAQPKAEQASGFLVNVANDGLDPADYPAPKFDNTDPLKLAADELTMTNSVLTFARHASIGSSRLHARQRGYLFRAKSAGRS